MITLTYAGIGARNTPPSVLTAMTVMAGWLARQGWRLNSGGAAGADSAFAEGAPAGQRTLHLPLVRLQQVRGAGLPGAVAVRA